MAHCSTEEGAGAGAEVEAGGLGEDLLAVMLPRLLLVAHWNHPHTCAAWGCRRAELGACTHAHGPLTKQQLRRLDAACPGCSFVAAHNSQVLELALRRLDEEGRAAAEGDEAQATAKVEAEAEAEAAGGEFPDSWQKRVASFQPSHTCSKWKQSITSRMDPLENCCVADVNEEGFCCKGSCSPHIQNFRALTSKIPVSMYYDCEEMKDTNDPPCPGCYVFQAHEEFMNFYLEDSEDNPQKGSNQTLPDNENSGKRKSSEDEDIDVEFLVILEQQMMMLNQLNLFYEEGDEDDDDDDDDDENFMECRHRSAG